jgi:hypothetical protein
MERAIPWPEPTPEPTLPIRGYPIVNVLRSRILPKPHVFPQSASYTESYPHGFLRAPIPKDSSITEVKLRPELLPLPGEPGLFQRRQQPQLTVYHRWTPDSVRVGAVGMKMGMMTMWNAHGEVLPITVIKVGHLARSIMRAAPPMPRAPRPAPAPAPAPAAPHDAYALMAVITDANEFDNDNVDGSMPGNASEDRTLTEG